MQFAGRFARFDAPVVDPRRPSSVRERTGETRTHLRWRPPRETVKSPFLALRTSLLILITLSNVPALILVVKETSRWVRHPRIRTLVRQVIRVDEVACDDSLRTHALFFTVLNRFRCPSLLMMARTLMGRLPNDSDRTVVHTRRRPGLQNALGRSPLSIKVKVLELTTSVLSMSDLILNVRGRRRVQAPLTGVGRRACPVEESLAGTRQRQGHRRTLTSGTRATHNTRGRSRLSTGNSMRRNTHTRAADRGCRRGTL